LPRFALFVDLPEPEYDMNLISRLLPPSNILLGLSASSKKRVFEQAGLLFENNQAIARAAVFDSLFARERLGSTGLGQGVAIPHGRIKGLKEAVAAFVRLQEPVPFDAPDGRPVQLLIFLLVPEQATQQHLDILSELAQMLSDKSFREGLLAATEPKAAHAMLATWESVRPAA
jgi:nitrogen PTS system EIIA component